MRRLIRSNGLNIMAQTFYRRPAFCIPWAHEAAMASNQQPDDSPLTPYRALDLTEGGFNWCGKVLADMGADVIKVEPVGGSGTRFRGPFYKDDPHPEKSLFWWAYCVNKRGITLDIESSDGRELFKKLAAKSDFILESFKPGYMDSLGLGYEALSADNPGLVMTSMTPFGQTGPYAHFKATDIVAWSMGGQQYASGNDDRPPVRVSFPQAELHGGAQGAAGTMTALWQRTKSGEGQQVDVSMQTSVIWTLMNATHHPPIMGNNMERAGGARKRNGHILRSIFQCQDGYVVANIGGGGTAGRDITVPGLIQWMDEDGVKPDFMNDVDYSRYSAIDTALSGEEGAKLQQATQQALSDFLATKTKGEIYARALSHRLLMSPCNTVKDIRESIQLEARDFWLELYHPEVDAMVTYLGPYIKMGESPIQLRRAAPRIGQHNEDVYMGVLGIDRERLIHLKQVGVI